MYENIFESAALLGKNILDIGTGEGNMALYLGERVGQNGSVTTIDIDSDWTEKMRLTARERGLEDIIIPYCADARNLNFCDDDYFDIAVASGAFIDIEDFNPGSSKAVLMEAYRVLKPGGKLIISQFHPYIQPQNEAQKVFYDYLELQTEILRIVEDEQMVCYPPEWFAEQTKKVGFVDIDWKMFPGKAESIAGDHLQFLQTHIERIECVNLRKRYYNEITSIIERQEEYGAAMIFFALYGTKRRT
jgi:ubiquinone/menaquinone biosynthesis C-methylase UbiE